MGHQSILWEEIPMSALTDEAQKKLDKVDTLLDAYSQGPVNSRQYKHLSTHMARAVDMIAPLIARIKELEEPVQSQASIDVYGERGTACGLQICAKGNNHKGPCDY
jgi:hypothetical protein